MGKIGRMKKHSHWKYSKSAKNGNRQVQSSTSISLPFKYLFSLRNVPPAVTNQPSINNYSSVFSSLSRDLVFNNKWNLIEHSDLFLMLCTFTQAAVPVPEKTIIVNTDFTFRVISCNVDVPLNSFTDIPDRLVNVEYLIKLLDHVDRSVVCSGIKCNDKLHELAKSGGRNGIFKDSRGEIKAKYNGDVIRPVNCNGLFSEGSACEHCKCYKKILMTMLSNKSKKLSSVIRKTNVNSHCPWKYLNSEEVELRVKIADMRGRNWHGNSVNWKKSFNRFHILICYNIGR